MAQVPIPNGVQVQPSSAPTPGQNITAPAGAFAANTLGQAAGEYAQTAKDISTQQFNYAQQFQAINNKVAADDATVKAIGALDKMRGDYQNNNQGMAAMTNLPQFYKDVEATRASFGQDLSPLAKVEFDSASRRYLANVQSESTSFAATQRKHAVLQSSDAVVATNQAIAAGAEYGSDQFNSALGAIAKEVAFQSQPGQLGLTPEVAQALLHEKVGAIFQSQVKQRIDSGDYLAAQDIFQAHKTDMTLDQINQVAGALKVGATAFTAKDFATSILNGQAPVDSRPATAAGANSDYLGGVHDREGMGQNPFSSASGDGQFVKGTWLKVLKTNPEFAGVIAGKSDAEILALRSNVQVGDQAILAYGRANAAQLQKDGVTPTKANVGLAHGYGSAGAEAILHADPGTSMAAIVGEKVAENNRVGDKTAGQVVSNFQQRFGGAAFNAQAGAPSVQANLPPPPKWTTGEDPQQFQADSDAYIVNSAHKLYGDNPVLEQQAIQSARSLIGVQIQQHAAEQSASYNRLFLAVEGGAEGTSARPLTTDELTKAYPGAANDLASIGPKGQAMIGENLNRANSPYGLFITPNMQANEAKLEGLAMNQPKVFADPAATDLTKWDLSAGDRRKFMDLQRTMHNSQAAQDARTTQLKTYLANPVVASIVKSNFPAKTGDDYLGFLGALQAQVQVLHGADGKSPSPDEVSKAAQSLITQHGGFLGLGAKSNYEVPEDEAGKINSQFKPQFGRDLSAYEISEIYHYNGGRGGR